MNTKHHTNFFLAFECWPISFNCALLPTTRPPKITLSKYFCFILEKKNALSIVHPGYHILRSGVCLSFYACVYICLYADRWVVQKLTSGNKKKKKNWNCWNILCVWSFAMSHLFHCCWVRKKKRSKINRYTHKMRTTYKVILKMKERKYERKTKHTNTKRSSLFFAGTQSD